MSEWISMKDELPDEGEFIIMRWHGKTQQCIYYRTSDDDGCYYQDSMDDYDAMQESEAFKGDMHWMYLPK